MESSLTKSKNKDSGTFRSIEGAQSSCDLLSAIKTIRQLGLDVKSSLNKIINGQYDFISLGGLVIPFEVIPRIVTHKN